MSSSTSRVAKQLKAKAQPHLVKTWAAYSFTRGLQSQHLSPFELDIAGSLTKGAWYRARTKVADNLPIWAPPLLATFMTVQYVKHLREEYLMEHRD